MDTPISLLPNECLSEIFYWLDRKSLLAVSLVNIQWSGIARTHLKKFQEEYYRSQCHILNQIDSNDRTLFEAKELTKPPKLLQKRKSPDLTLLELSQKIERAILSHFHRNPEKILGIKGIPGEAFQYCINRYVSKCWERYFGVYLSHYANDFTIDRYTLRGTLQTIPSLKKTTAINLDFSVPEEFLDQYLSILNESLPKCHNINKLSVGRLKVLDESNPDRTININAFEEGIKKMKNLNTIEMNYGAKLTIPDAISLSHIIEEREIKRIIGYWSVFDEKPIRILMEAIRSKNQRIGLYIWHAGQTVGDGLDIVYDGINKGYIYLHYGERKKSFC